MTFRSIFFFFIFFISSCISTKKYQKAIGNIQELQEGINYCEKMLKIEQSKSSFLEKEKEDLEKEVAHLSKKQQQIKENAKKSVDQVISIHNKILNEYQILTQEFEKLKKMYTTLDNSVQTTISIYEDRIRTLVEKGK